MLKRLVLSVLLTAPAAASAAGVVFIPERSCADLQAAVSGPGSAILFASPTVHDRYVRDATFCSPRDDIRMANLRSRDKAACFVGYTCKPWSNFRSN